jgi:hypothetical protein
VLPEVNCKKHGSSGLTAGGENGALSPGGNSDSTVSIASPVTPAPTGSTKALLDAIASKSLLSLARVMCATVSA